MKIAGFEKANRDMPKENERLQVLINKNKHLREERDREYDLRRQLEEDIAAKVKTFHTLYQEALAGKRHVTEQLRIIMTERPQPREEDPPGRDPENYASTEPREARVVSPLIHVFPIKKFLI